VYEPVSEERERARFIVTYQFLNFLFHFGNAGISEKMGLDNTI